MADRAPLVERDEARCGVVVRDRFLERLALDLDVAGEVILNLVGDRLVLMAPGARPRPPAPGSLLVTGHLSSKFGSVDAIYSPELMVECRTNTKTARRATYPPSEVLEGILPSKLPSDVASRMPLDLIIRRARRPGEDDLVDIGMADGRITAVEAGLRDDASSRGRRGRASGHAAVRRQSFPSRRRPHRRYAAAQRLRDAARRVSPCGPSSSRC